TAGNRSNSPRHVSPNSICRSTGPTSAACWRAVKERPSIECVQAKAWHLLIECFGFPERGGTASMPVREKQPERAGSRPVVPVSGLVQAHSPAESRVFAAVGMEGTGERDSPPEGRGFEPSVPARINDALGTALFASAAPPVPPKRPTRFARGTGSSNPLRSAE